MELNTVYAVEYEKDGKKCRYCIFRIFEKALEGKKRCDKLYNVNSYIKVINKGGRS